MKAITLKIEGMHCSGCSAIVQRLLERTPGVRKATASFEQSEARVLYDGDAIDEAKLVAAIERGGYRVTSRSAG